MWNNACSFAGGKWFQFVLWRQDLNNSRCVSNMSKPGIHIPGCGDHSFSKVHGYGPQKVFSKTDSHFKDKWPTEMSMYGKVVHYPIFFVLQIHLWIAKSFYHTRQVIYAII